MRKRVRLLVIHMIKQLPLLVLGVMAVSGCGPHSPSAGTSSPPPSNPGASDPAGKDSKAARVESQIRGIVAKQLKLAPERIQLSSRWQDLGADSLDFVELIMTFEEEFHVEIPDERAEAMKTVGDAVSFVTQQSRP